MGMKGLLQLFFYYIRLSILKILLFCKIIYKKKKPFSVIAKGLRIDELPLLERFRTFKGDIALENIKLNQLVFQ